MKRYRSLFSEKYFWTGKVSSFFTGKTMIVEVFKNPSLREIESVPSYEDEGALRGCIYGRDLYVWDANVLHTDIVSQMFDWDHDADIYIDFEYSRGNFTINISPDSPAKKVSVVETIFAHLYPNQTVDIEAVAA